MMLEKYDKNVKPEEWVRHVQEIKGMTKSQALAFLRKEVPKESYFQKKVKEALRAAYPDAIVLKVAQGFFSEGGIPDIMFVWRGHYFGFEIKRPVFGTATKNQKLVMKRIEDAGGTAAIVTYPEEAFGVINGYFSSREEALVSRIIEMERESFRG